MLARIFASLAGVPRYLSGVSKGQALDTTLGLTRNICSGLDTSGKFLFNLLTKKNTDTFVGGNALALGSLAGVGGLMLLNHSKAGNEMYMTEDGMKISKKDNSQMWYGALALTLAGALPFAARLIPGLSHATGALSVLRKPLEDSSSLLAKGALLALSPLTWASGIGMVYGASYMYKTGTADGNSWLANRTLAGLPIFRGVIIGSKDFGVTTRTRELDLQRAKEATENGIYRPGFNVYETVRPVTVNAKA